MIACHPLAHLIGRLATRSPTKPRAVRSASATAPAAARVKPKRRRIERANPEQIIDFAHLRHSADARAEAARADRERMAEWSGAPLVDDPGELADAILAAGRRSRTPTDRAKPIGLAAKIIAAGRTRRGEIGSSK